MWALAVSWAALAILTPVALDPGVFTPYAEMEVPGFPSLAFYHSNSDEVITLRLSVPLEEAPDEAGSGQILRRLAQDRMDPLASRVGAQVRVTRHGSSLVYEVSGAAVDLDFLGWILREGLRAPDLSRFEEVRRRTLADVARRMETPQGVIALQLRESLAPGSPPPQGTLPALERMDVARIQSVWGRAHRRSLAQVVVVGNLPTEVVLAALTDLGLAEEDAYPYVGASVGGGQPRLRPEVIRTWAAEAWTWDGGRDPRALVAIRLLSESIQSRRGEYELGVEIWEVSRRWVLVLSGAAYPRGQQAMRTRLQGLLREAQQGVTDEAVRRHAAEVRREFLDAARTPWGLAELVGQARDLGESPSQMEAFVEELQRMEAADLRRFLDGLLASRPIRQEIRP
jgi:hypothetical protein